ncbi:MAG: hypothetical protein VB017_08235 [Endomicrobiaceae bacterium]|nr:hypothetical protein [Endomicrobiaceae bacterium]
MKKILVISQKELVKEPVFRQDKNLIEMLGILTKENEAELLYLHKNIKKEGEISDGGDGLPQINKYCLRDMMQKNALKKNINKLLAEKKYDSIIFMSYSMAQLMMPYIDAVSDKTNIIVDFRLSRIEYIMYQYMEEMQKSYANVNTIYKDLKINFLQSIAVFEKSDFCIFDKEDEFEFLNKNGIKNIITIDKVPVSLEKKREKRAKRKTVEIVCNNNNFSSKSDIPAVEIVKENEKYILNGSKKSNLIDAVNDIILKNDADYFCFYNEKIKIMPDSFEMMSKYFYFNDNIALVAPSVIQAQGLSMLQFQSYFEEQRYNNFTNWEECQPLFFSECFVVRKDFVKKIGYFDNRFETLNYALFDFIVRLYRIRAYFFVMRDVPVFKTSAVKQTVTLFKKDRNYLCSKWGEFDFSFETGI